MLITSISFITNYNQMKNKNSKPSTKHHIIETWATSITHIDMTALSSDALIKRCGVNLVV